MSQITDVTTLIFLPLFLRKHHLYSCKPYCMYTVPSTFIPDTYPNLLILAFESPATIMPLDSILT